MDKDKCIYFRDQLRNARANALRDAEGYDQVLFAIEALGRFLTKKGTGLGRYKPELEKLSRLSALYDVSEECRDWHMPFASLFEVVLVGRNDAMHQGVAARHLTAHVVQLALILEDALMSDATAVGDYMVRNPICAQMWQPISFVRQQMLAESFSYLPVLNGKQWCLISDQSVAQYIKLSEKDNKERLMHTVEQVCNDFKKEGVDLLIKAQTCCAKTPLKEIIGNFDGKPLLVCRDGEPDEPTELVGILTAFDLL